MRHASSSIDNLVSERAVVDALEKMDRGILRAGIAGYDAFSRFAERMNDVLVAAAGNRVTLLGYALAASPTIAKMLAPAEWRETAALLCTPGYLAGVFLTGQTGLGAGTYSHYKRAVAHIKEHGRLDPRYAEGVILGSENRAFVGYCQQQGLYLAARDYGQIEVFEKTMEEHSNVRIPHF